LVITDKDNPSGELMRKDLLDINGNNLENVNTIIGQLK
jgi:hypothetical protein